MPREEERTTSSVTAGWQRRILSKVGGSAAVGLAAGALLSLLSRGRAANASSASALPRVAPWALRTAGSCALCAATFALPLEGVRAVRGEHSPLNSAVAGGLAVGVLSSVHRSGGSGSGRASAAALPLPLLFAMVLGAAAAASSVHAAGDWATDGRGLARPLLENLGLLDPPKRLVRESEAKAAAAAEVERQQAEERERLRRESSSSSPASIVGVPLHPWLEWLPIRKLTPEEAALRKVLKEEEFRENARLAAQGGMPVAAAVDAAAAATSEKEKRN
jgi:hypothetical protein